MLLPPVVSLVDRNTTDLFAVAAASPNLQNQPREDPLARFMEDHDETTIQRAQAVRASLGPHEYSFSNTPRPLESDMWMTSHSHTTRSWVSHGSFNPGEFFAGTLRSSENASTVRGSSSHSSSVVPTSEYRSGSSAPSLTHGGSSNNPSTVSTSIGRNIHHGPVLDLDGQTLERDPTNLLCCFQWQGCEGQFRYMDQFREHTLSHWYPHEPPNFFDCPLCDYRAGNFPNGYLAWEERLNHLALHHIQGHDLSTARPETKLIKYMRRKRMISDGDYKNMLSSPHGPSTSGAVTTSNNPSRRDEHQTRR